jgi:opacity protein-like surface antigen
MIRFLSIGCLAIALGAGLPAWGHDQGQYGTREGQREVTLTGSGSSDNNFDAGGFGASGSFGYFFTDNFEGLIRQSASFSDSDESHSIFIGSTGLFADYHFPVAERWVPFVGAGIGLVYGDVDETGFIAPEVGLKFFALESTFVFAQAQYQFFFENASAIDDNFDDGQFVYSLGLGFLF